MRAWPLLVLFVPSLATAYNPSPADLLAKMEAAWAKVKPVELRLRHYDGDGTFLGENTAAVPGRNTAAPKDPEGFVPFAELLAGVDNLASAVPTLLAQDAATGAARLGTTVCYVLKGRAERLWLRKADLLPMRVERLLDNGEWAVTSYLGLVILEDRVPCPSRSEFTRAGKLLLVESLVRDPPTPSSP